MVLSVCLSCFLKAKFAFLVFLLGCCKSQAIAGCTGVIPFTLLWCYPDCVCTLMLGCLLGWLLRNLLSLDHWNLVHWNPVCRAVVSFTYGWQLPSAWAETKHQGFADFPDCNSRAQQDGDEPVIAESHWRNAASEPADCLGSDIIYAIVQYIFA